MSYRLYTLDVPENVPIVKAATKEPNVEIGKVGPYFVISSEQPFSIDRRATGARHAVWYSCVSGIGGCRIGQWDKDALRLEER